MDKSKMDDGVKFLTQGLLGYMVSQLPDRELRVTPAVLEKAREDLGEDMVMDLDISKETGELRLFYREKTKEDPE
ncbi:MAG: hypothetical protein Unbinned767contig1000_11 [Prokaryotic dsDNA virus sp.]|nr:MAG: hypothetical protein Unbinned767contig1000_11 [Prokaryotic dsDNA virus sp.]|tara:strand:+ start:3945 stop:4169 length:225 start_codon:yes stop_codon:yes gene_type:complete